MADRRLLAQRTAALALTPWHLTAARILCAIHGLDTALTFLAQCAGTTQEVRHG